MIGPFPRLKVSQLFNNLRQENKAPLMQYLQVVKEVASAASVTSDDKHQLGCEQLLAQQAASAAPRSTLLVDIYTSSSPPSFSADTMSSDQPNPPAKRARVDDLFSQTMHALNGMGGAVFNEIRPQLQEHILELQQLASLHANGATHR